VVLFDEIEKRSGCDAFAFGRFSGRQNHRLVRAQIDFRNTIIIMDLECRSDVAEENRQ